MFVACPHCGFLVAAQAGASLRCPRCGSPIDPKQAKPLEVTPTPTLRDAEPAADAGTDDGDNAAATATKEDTAAAPAPPAPRRKAGIRAPSFARRHAPAPARRRNSRAVWIVAALAVLLVLQLLLAQRSELAADAHWRPLISNVCGVLRCEIPAWREPAAFTMLQRSVQPKAGVRGVLHVNSSFRNDARWSQPWPTVVLTLSDMDGREVGVRAFTPDEYGHKADASRIAPGQSATIELDVVEPAQQVVAFTFDFK